MRALIRTNDPVLVSFVEALMRDAGIAVHVADVNMSIVEGSIGIFPRRVMVPDADWENAAQLLKDADLGQWVIRDGSSTDGPG